MIFTQPLYGKVLRGEKTETRRLALPSHPPHKYRVKQRIAVQKGRGVSAEAHIILTAVRRERLGLLDFDAARAEGFRTTLHFKVYWVAIHDKAWVEKWDEGEDTYDAAAVARFEKRWAPKEVWVLTFERDHSERPRLLAHRNARANYVEHPAQAMPHEPEAVPANIQKGFSREKTEGFVAREADRQADRERLGLVERLQIALSEGGDPRVEESIRKRIRALESRNRRRA